MDWANEKYVRLYTRNTVDWRLLPWQSRALFPLLLREADRAGTITLGKHGVSGLAVSIGLPPEVVEPGLAALIADGSVEHMGTTLVLPNFLDAQETPQTDRQRARESRARRRDRARSAPPTPSTPPAPDAGTTAPSAPLESSSVTNCDASITKRDSSVTPGHTASHGVTPSELSPSEPSKPALPSATPEPAWCVEHGTPAMERATDAYIAAISAATGGPFAMSAWRTERGLLALAVNEHFKSSTTVSAAIIAMAAAATAWVDEYRDRPQFAGNWAPKNFLSWLNGRATRPTLVTRRSGVEWIPPADVPPASSADIAAARAARATLDDDGDDLDLVPGGTS